MNVSKLTKHTGTTLPGSTKHFTHYSFSSDLVCRDELAGNATGTFINTTTLVGNETFKGQTSANGFTYETTVNYVPGLLPNTSDGINHFITVGDGQNAVDGLIDVFEVHIVTQPTTTSSGYSFFAIYSERNCE